MTYTAADPDVKDDVRISQHWVVHRGVVVIAGVLAIAIVIAVLGTEVAVCGAIGASLRGVGDIVDGFRNVSD